MMRSLLSLKEGETSCIQSLQVEPVLLKSLVSQGVTPGKRVEVVWKPWFGSLIVCCNDVEFLVTRKEAKNIIVV